MRLYLPIRHEYPVYAQAGHGPMQSGDRQQTLTVVEGPYAASRAFFAWIMSALPRALSQMTLVLRALTSPSLQQTIMHHGNSGAGLSSHARLRLGNSISARQASDPLFFVRLQRWTD